MTPFHTRSVMLGVGFLLITSTGCSGDAPANARPNASARPATRTGAQVATPSRASSRRAQAQGTIYDRPGFVTALKDGRLWVMRAGTPEAAALLADGKTPVNHVIRPNAGPAGLTIRAPDGRDIIEYLGTKPGFQVFEHNGRLWVYRADSPDLAKAAEGRHPVNHVIRPLAGPAGITLRASDIEIINDYIAAKPGFITGVKDGRIWVFAEDDPAGAEFRATGKTPVNHVIRPNAGPLGMTVRSPDADVLVRYIIARDGFVTGIVDGRIWVFPAHAPEAAEFLASGKTPVNHVIRPNAGPLGMTVRATDARILDAYAPLQTVAVEEPRGSIYDRPGFVTTIKDGRLWVMRSGTPEASAMLNEGRTPVNQVIRPAVGPAGMTVRAIDHQDIIEYLGTRPGFRVFEHNGRLWVYRADSPDLAKAAEGRHPVNHVIRPLAGPAGITLRASDIEIINDYIAAKPGFITGVKDGRIWVFAQDDPAGAEFLATGKTPVNHVIRPNAGPLGMTVRSPDADVLVRYIIAREGFVTGIVDGRIWVFPAHSSEADEFLVSGKTPVNHVIRPNAGPLGMTVRATDASILDAYLR